MKQFKRLFAVAVFFMTALSMSSQCFIRTVDGKHYWCENKIENIKDVDEIVVSQNKILTRIPKKDVVLIEYEEYGVEILQPDKLDKVEPKACNRNYESFLARGKRVYIPYSSTDNCERYGARRLRELMEASHYYQVVDCQEEADFIIKYVFDDKGSDHAYLMFIDRMGNEFLRSKNVGASYIGPIRAGQKSVEKLYDKLHGYMIRGRMMDYVKKGITK